MSKKQSHRVWSLGKPISSYSNILEILGKNIYLPSNILSFFCDFDDILKNKVIVILSNVLKLNFCHVWCISFRGEIVWKFNEGNYLGVNHPFKSMYVDGKGDLWLINLAGAHYRVDPKTGESKEVKYKNMDFKIIKKKGIFTSDKVVFPNGKEIKVREGVHSYYCYQGEVLVVIEDKSTTKADNVAAYDKGGQKLWDFLSPYNMVKNRVGNAYTKNEGKDLWLNTWYGTAWRIEPYTGEILEDVFLK